MFKSLQVDLPASTQFILTVSACLTNYGIYALVAVVILASMLRKSLQKPEIRQKMETYLFRMPFIGDVLLKTHVARFCRTLGTLLQAQVSLIEALTVSERIATNADIRAEIAQIIKYVRRGGAIAEPLVDSKLFPPMVVQMVTVGEETSELDAMLLKVADYYEKDLDSKIDSLSSVIEPVIVLFLGLLVAAILVSMYLPMFDLVNLMRLG
jgi:type IV pilus assembly protein PilC